VTSGPISAPGRCRGRSSAGDRGRQLLDQRVGRGLADRHGDRDRHAALAGRAVGRHPSAHRRPGRYRHPASRSCGSWHRPAPGRVCRPRAGRDRRTPPMGSPTKLTAAISGSSRIASTAVLVAVDDIEDALAGSPASIISSASIIGQDGSFSDGFQDEGVAARDGRRNIHIGIIAGKLKGVMPATTPTGWRMDSMSMPGPTFGILALQEVRDAAGELADLEAALDVALGVGMVLPCSRASVSATTPGCESGTREGVCDRGSCVSCRFRAARYNSKVVVAQRPGF
jgi:hypothetical protein